MINYLVYYLIIINSISFILMGVDKFFAIRKKRRISELCLISFSFFGGAFVKILEMLIFHHKTKHIKFLLLNPLFLLIWVLLMIKFV